MHSKFPWTVHSHTPTAVFDADGKRIVWDAPDGWRDIETAPKDGADVVLYCPRGDGNPGSTYRVTVGRWESDDGGVTEHRDMQGRWIGQDENEGYEGWLSWDGGFSEDTMMPTHWQPLPAPLSDKPAPAPLDPETAAANAALIAAIPRMVEALEAYEQWEADIIMERKCWEGPMTVQLTRDLYNRMIEIQGMRNAVLASIGRVK